MAKIEPAVLDLRYRTTGSGNFYIDIAKGLSQINRRLYRQGRQYYVAGVTLVNQTNLDGNAAYAQAVFATAPTSWVCHEAWTKMFRAWNGQHNKTAKDLGVKRGKWADFKVYLEDAHRSGTELALQDGDDASPAAVDAAQEWAHSEIIWSADSNSSGVPTAYSPTMHILGDHNGSNLQTSIGIIQSYQDSRTTVSADQPNTPGSASSSIFAFLGDLAAEDAVDLIASEIEDDNDNPPYDLDEYPGSSSNANHPHIVAWASTAGGTASVKGFIAPCGLVQIQTDAAMEVIFHLMPGEYRGVMAPPMGQ